MDSFNKWFGRFLWGTDVILLAASTPHIAAWYEHFDNPSAGNWLGLIYAWAVGYGLAIAIDGVSLMLLMALTRMINQDKKQSGWVTFGLLVFMTFIVILSWSINVQYDVQFASNAFAKADQMYVPFTSLTFGQINPVIGGAFQVLILAYALIGKAMKSEVKPAIALTDNEHEQMLKRIRQEKEIKEARKGKGIVAKIGEGLTEAKQVYSNLKQSESIDETEEENQSIPQRKTDRITGPLRKESVEESEEKAEGNPQGNGEESNQETNENLAIDPGLIPLVARYPKAIELLSTSASTVGLPDVANAFEVTLVLLRNRVKSGKIRKTKNAEIVYKDSVISWAKSEMLSRGKTKIIDIETARHSQEKIEEKQVVNGQG